MGVLGGEVRFLPRGFQYCVWCYLCANYVLYDWYNGNARYVCAVYSRYLGVYLSSNTSTKVASYSHRYDSRGYLPLVSTVVRSCLLPLSILLLLLWYCFRRG